MSTDTPPTYGTPDPTFALAPLRQALEHLTALEDLLDGIRFNDSANDYRDGACVRDLRTLLVVELRVHEKVALARQSRGPMSTDIAAQRAYLEARLRALAFDANAHDLLGCRLEFAVRAARERAKLRKQLARLLETPDAPALRPHGADRAQPGAGAPTTQLPRKRHPRPAGRKRAHDPARD